MTRLFHDIAAETAKALPPLAVAVGAAIQGITINHVVGIATVLYILLQAIVLLRKERRATRADRRTQAGEGETE